LNIWDITVLLLLLRYHGGVLCPELRDLTTGRAQVTDELLALGHVLHLEPGMLLLVVEMLVVESGRTGVAHQLATLRRHLLLVWGVPGFRRVQLLL